MVTSADENGLNTKEGEFIHADLMVWAAGIKAPDFMKDIAGLETNRINQLVVEPTLQTTRDPNIFAIGDCASCRNRAVVLFLLARSLHIRWPAAATAIFWPYSMGRA